MLHFLWLSKDGERVKFRLHNYDETGGGQLDKESTLKKLKLDTLEIMYPDAEEFVPLAFDSQGLSRDRFMADKTFAVSGEPSTPVHGPAQNNNDSLRVEDVSEAYTDALFAPFDRDNFPLQLEPGRIRELLYTPPATSVPVPNTTLFDLRRLWPDSFTPGRPLFTQAAPNQTATRLQSRLTTALYASWSPQGHSSELGRTSYWDNVGFDLPDFVAGILHLDINVNRDIEDTTITAPQKRRDYFVQVEGRLCVGGEDKPTSWLYETAVRECKDKHQGANAAVYGRLQYILLTVVAGEMMGVYAMQLSGDYNMERIVEPFPINTTLGRRRVLLIFINISRWLRTLLHLRALPPAASLSMLVPMQRPSPFNGVGEEQYALTMLTMHLRSVEKVMAVPAAHMQRLLDVYGMLSTSLPHAIKCTKFLIDAEEVPLQHPMATRAPVQGVGSWHVALTLEPVAANWHPHGETDLWSLCRCILEALAAAHDMGFVHRDVRDCNILQDGLDSYILIDWELAGRSGDLVFWPPRKELMPPGVGMRTPWEPWMDLWQLGRVMQRSLLHGKATRDFALKLMSRVFLTAKQALEQLPM